MTRASYTVDTFSPRVFLNVMRRQMPAPLLLPPLRDRVRPPFARHTVAPMVFFKLYELFKRFKSYTSFLPLYTPPS